MITINRLEDECSRAIKKLTPDDILRVRTWKGDRGFSISLSDDGYELIEDGFQNERYTFRTDTALRKAVRRIAKREFPRSHKLRFSLTAKRS